VLKVAIVGCGKIADSHASQIIRIKGSEIVGVCDREPLMARQLYERFPVRRYFGDVAELLTEARPDVVHITTPPQSHFEIATICLERGCHVYVEKPFTLYAEDAQALVDLATKRGLKLTVGHDDQFSRAARRMRELVRTGFLGGPPVHMESHFGYELDDTHARALLHDPHHWVRRLPGKLLHNIISHGIARIAEFLATDSPEVIAHGFASPLLRRIGETDIVDELRVVISEQPRTTAYFTFTSQMRPSLHQFAIYGPQNGLVLNQDQETVIKLRGRRLKSYLEQFIAPVMIAQQYVGSAARNGRAFLERDCHPKSGMKHLIESFYRSITDGLPVPIPYREILLTATIMERIFEQVHASGRPETLDDRSPLAVHAARR
jgi:predicted dehydrogenase